MTHKKTHTFLGLLIGTIILQLAALKTDAQYNTYLIDGVVINSNDPIDPKMVNTIAIEHIIIDKINTLLDKKGLNFLTEDDLLKKVATDQASYMALVNQSTLDQDTKGKETTADRMMFYGGSKNAMEIADKTNLTKSGIAFTYEKVSDDIVFKWFTSAKKAKLFESGKYNLIGLNVATNQLGKRIYLSVVLGNYKSFNDGAALSDQLPIPYSTKSYGLSDPDPIYCKKIYRNNNLSTFQKAISVEGNAIYIALDDTKALKRIIKKSKDGLAVEILQKEQFACDGPNIMDNNLAYQGIITKKLYAKKLFKHNLADIEEHPKAFKTQLGMLPEGLNDGYELNLVFIQNKSFCKSIQQDFTIQTSGTYTRNVKLLADTVSINSRFAYKPIADSMQLSLRIPFESNKSSYETEDIEPFIKLLNEPAFFIYDIKITAYSSIEGSDRENKILQQRRAQSIVDALSRRQRDSIKTEIITNYNWVDFEQDVKSTQHNILASMEIEEAQSYIRQYNLGKDLEPILSNHRYAQIDMKVTYDISGENEKPFVLKKFQNALSDNDIALALSIEKFIFKQVISNRYTNETLNELNIAVERQNAGLLMNKYWLLHKTKQISNDELREQVANLHALDPNNEYIAFNHIFLTVKNPDVDLTDAGVQTKIDRLYYSHLQKETVDGLNIKYQFKQINYADSVKHDAKLRASSINRIKEIVDINDETLENSLKLAELFIDNRDYSFALSTLEPWVMHSDANEKLIYTYISLCSHYDQKMHAQKFNYAMDLAQQLNPDRYCKLFNGDYFSLRIFENPEVKSSYCEHCIGSENMASE